MSVFALILIAGSLLLALSAILLVAADRLSLPHSVLLALLGLVIGLTVHLGFADTLLPSDINAAFAQLRLPSDGLLYLFLPPLLFSAGLAIDVRRLLDEVAAVFLLAVVAVVLCTGLVGIALYYSGLASLAAALLLGAVVATTDSAAVIAVFRDLGAPRRLTTLVEGESLFNDAAAIVIFVILTAYLAGAGAPTPGAGLLEFAIALAGGLGLGFIAARIGAWFVSLLGGFVVAETTATIVLAYAVFVVGEYLLQVSGVVAVVVAALTFSGVGRTRVSPEGWRGLVEIWRHLEFWAASLVFILASMTVPELIAGSDATDLWGITVVVLATLVARAIILSVFMPLLSTLGLVGKVGAPEQFVLLWGGLRGAMTLALALAVWESTALPEEVRLTVAPLAAGYVLFTLLVQAPTLRPIMRAFRLDRLSPVDQLIRDRTLALSRRIVNERTMALAKTVDLPEERLESLIVSEGEGAGAEPRHLDKATEIQAAFTILAHRESELYMAFFEGGIVSRRITEQMRAQAAAQVDAVRSEGEGGYRICTARLTDAGPMFRFALWLHRTTGLDFLLAEQIADRFEHFLLARFMIGELRDYVDQSLEPLFGAEVAACLRDALNERADNLDRAIEALEAQYTEYADQIQTRYVARASQRYEASEYERRLDTSLISPEVFRVLMNNLSDRRDQVLRRPQLNLGFRLLDMIAAVPLFSALDPAELGRVGRMLRPRLCLPGEHVVTKGQPGSEMFFIVAGSVRVVLDEGAVPLGPGDFFGEMALLNKAPRSHTVVTDGYVHLLALDKRDLDRLIRLDRKIGDAIRAAAEDRQRQAADGVPQTA